MMTRVWDAHDTPFLPTGLLFRYCVFALWQKGCHNVVAVMGNHVSLEQEQLIAASVGPKGRVLIAFDDDEAGRKGSADAAARLAPHVFVRTVSLA
jgi:DNA primase